MALCEEQEIRIVLYRAGYFVGKYISLESKIAKYKDLYYDALYDS